MWRKRIERVSSSPFPHFGSESTQLKDDEIGVALG